MRDLFKKYPRTIFLALAFIVIFGYPFIIRWKNPVPSENNLTSFHAKIIDVSEINDGVTLVFPEGVVGRAFFPAVNNSILTTDRRFSGLTITQAKLLKNCDATIYGKKVDWQFPSRFFVWRVDCAAIDVPFSQIKSTYEKEVDFNRWLQFGLVVIVIFVLYLVFKKEGKKA